MGVGGGGGGGAYGGALSILMRKGACQQNGSIFRGDSVYVYFITGFK